MYANPSTKLNKYQIKAVQNSAKACLVNALVGSGKTTVLTAKIGYLISNSNIPLDKIAVLTFSNKAAREMITRLEADIANMSYIGTIHSVALKILRESKVIEELGFTNDFTVITPEEEIEIAADIISTNGLGIKYTSKLAKRIEQARRGKTRYGIMKDEDDILKLIAMIDTEKKLQNKLTFDDLLHYATQLLQKECMDFRWILIDEFQDVNSAQYAFIKTLMGEDTKIFAVGDENQEIYNFNGSGNIFAKYRKDFNPEELSLAENYRSTGNILKVAEPFKTSNGTLITSNSEGSKVVIKRHSNSIQEATYLVDRIRVLVENGMQYKDIAIFYRKLDQSNVLEDTFARFGIPFKVSAKRTLKDIPVLEWLMRLLKVCVNPSDTTNAIALLSNEIYGDLTMAGARKAVNTYCSDPKQSELLYKAMTFKEWSDSKSVKNLSSYFGLEYNLCPTAASYQEDLKITAIFLKKLEDYIVNKGLSLFDGIREFICSTALDGANILDEKVSPDENSVSLMTLHASKGLGFKQVFIIGVNDGLIPLRNNFKSDEIAEERRVFYVGITRAKENLELSYYVAPPERTVKPGKGWYLQQIPSDCIEEPDGCANSFDMRSFVRKLRRGSFVD